MWKTQLQQMPSWSILLCSPLGRRRHQRMLHRKKLAFGGTQKFCWRSLLEKGVCNISSSRGDKDGKGSRKIRLGQDGCSGRKRIDWTITGFWYPPNRMRNGFWCQRRNRKSVQELPECFSYSFCFLSSIWISAFLMESVDTPARINTVARARKPIIARIVASLAWSK